MHYRLELIEAVQSGPRWAWKRTIPAGFLTEMPAPRRLFEALNISYEPVVVEPRAGFLIIKRARDQRPLIKLSEIK